MPDRSRLLPGRIPAVILIGLAKGGFAGLGALGMPIMALGVAPVRGAAILLPILIAQDVVGVTAFRKTWDRKILLIMLPGAILGVGLGWLFAASVPADAVLAAVGAISILFGALSPLGRARRADRGGRQLARLGRRACSASPPASPARSPMPAARLSRCG